MPPDPLAGTHQVCFAHYASYIAHDTLLTPILMLLATTAMLSERSTSQLIYFC